MKRFRQGKRGLSPIFATLLLIAIAVIAAIVLYAYTSGSVTALTQGGGYASEKLVFDAVSGSYTSVQVYAHSLDRTMQVSSAVVKDASSGYVVAVVYQNSDYRSIQVGKAVSNVSLNIADGSPTSVQLFSGGEYTVTFVSASGTSFTSMKFTAS